MKSASEAVSVMQSLLHHRGTKSAVNREVHRHKLIWNQVDTGHSWTVAGYEVFIYEPPLPAEKGEDIWWGLAVFSSASPHKGINLLFSRVHTEGHPSHDKTSVTYYFETTEVIPNILKRIADGSPRSRPRAYLEALATALLRAHAALTN